MLIDITIFSLVATAILAAYMASFKALDLAKAKTAAVALANEKMEELRNMPYNSLATQNGVVYPPGDLLDNQVIVRRGIEFNVHVDISYVDDPFDSVAGGTPNDLYPYDYKKAEITVSKIGREGFLARLTTSIAAKAAETPGNSGIIQLCVVDSAGLPISEADVTISNTVVSPPVNILAQTEANGCLLVYNLPEDQQNQYHLTATKSGYSTDSTYPRTSQNPNALIPDVDVLIQQITNQTLVIDRTSSMSVDVVNVDGSPVSNATLNIRGTKRVYFNPDTYKYVANFITDANGHVNIPNIEFDSYVISIQGQTVLTTTPYQPINLKPNVDLPIRVMVGSSSLPSISSCEPTEGRVGENVSLKIIGNNFQNASLKIIHGTTGQEIIGTNIEVLNSKEINVDFNLTGAATGTWNILIQNSTGNITQLNGFTITE